MSDPKFNDAEFTIVMEFPQVDDGHFLLRLVRGREDDFEIWRIVEIDSRNKRVILLTYDSDGDRAREDAARYAADAIEVDLTSDFDPNANFFGERRIRRVS